jgi:hypothetical protein
MVEARNQQGIKELTSSDDTVAHQSHSSHPSQNPDSLLDSTFTRLDKERGRQHVLLLLPLVVQKVEQWGMLVV